ncbi:DNA polymerase III subunit gamma/tau C-terminal domain-containing protein, partial [Acidovorax sp. SRB_14]|uniref:DNA polymerase III subunit gamma/tau C-terminal domain-containing protein n=2 Tax=unclassified Acidovorax TaxID=2684926 RepID=UPI002739B66D
GPAAAAPLAAPAVHENAAPQRAAAPAASAPPAVHSEANETPAGVPLAADEPAARAELALPVRTPETLPAAPASAQAVSAPPAAQVRTLPVRTPPEPGARLQAQPGAASAGHPARGYTATEEGDVWHPVVQQLAASEAITALVRELALQSQLVARDGGHWLLRVERESLNQPTARERLRAALEAAGHAQQISVEIGLVIDSPARRNAVAEQERQRVALETVLGDPFVQAMVRDHDAKIVPGSVKPL